MGWLMKPSELKRIYEGSIENGEIRTVICGQDFSGMRIQEQDLKCVDFVDCRFAGTVFVDCDVRGSCFARSEVRGLTMVRCRVFGCAVPDEIGAVQFVDCARDLYGADTPGRQGAFGLAVRQVVAGFVSIAHMRTEKVLALAMLMAMVVMLVAMVKGAL